MNFTWRTSIISWNEAMNIVLNFKLSWNGIWLHFGIWFYFFRLNYLLLLFSVYLIYPYRAIFFFILNMCLHVCLYACMNENTAFVIIVLGCWYIYKHCDYDHISSLSTNVTAYTYIHHTHTHSQRQHSVYTLLQLTISCCASNTLEQQIAYIHRLLQQ